MRHIEKQREIERQQLFNAAIYYSQLSAMLKNRTFKAYFESREARFSWAGDAFFNKLQANLLFQTAKSYKRGEPRVEGFDSILAYADFLDSQVEYLVETYAFKIPKAKAKFSFKRGHCVTTQVYIFLKDWQWLDSNRFMTFYGLFDIQNVLHSLHDFVAAKYLLKYSTENAVFEKLLEGLTEEYIAKGYPHDLLVHDADWIFRGIIPYCIVMNKDYCSTHIFLSEHEYKEFNKCSQFGEKEIILF